MTISDFGKRMRRIFRFKRGPSYRPHFVAEEPTTVRPGLLYVIGTEQQRWAVVFKCPCGCGDDVWLNLLSGHHPRWEIRPDASGRIYLSPSVDRVVGCRSHFSLWRNRVQWCFER
jgi:hypothetical protein